jgi:hypothetical protein
VYKKLSSFSAIPDAQIQNPGSDIFYPTGTQILIPLNVRNLAQENWRQKTSPPLMPLEASKITRLLASAI